MDVSKIIRGIVNSRGYTITSAITQWDYGYVFVPEFEDMPATYRLDFSNDEHHGTALPVYCGSEGGEVPEELIDTGKDIFVWFFYTGDGFGKSEYKWRIPNHCKPKTEQDEPSPTQQSSIDQLIVRSNEAVTSAEQSASDASTSAQNASADAERVEEARTDAQNYATQAEQARDDAQTYANSASASATASAQSASQSAQIKADVEDLADDAQASANASAQSATASANSASQAQGYAQSASASAQSASGYASNAQSSAQTASSKASEASQSATTASQKATESAQSASQALGYKTDAESAKVASQTAQGLAESARDTAVQAKTDAEQAKADAESARDEAQQAVASISGALDDKAPIITDTASGAIASFTDGADDLPLKSLVVDINPIQDLSNGDPSPENICPISGWTQVDVEQRGKNLFDFEGFLNRDNITYEKSGDSFTFSPRQPMYTNPWRFAKKDSVVSVSVQSIANITSSGIKLRFLNDSGVTVFSTTDSVLSARNFVASQVKLDWSKLGRVTITAPQIEFGTENTSYEPYNGQSLTISLGQTVYGGKLNVLTGVLTVDRAMVDLGTLNWDYYTSGANPIFRVTIADKKANADMICSNYEKTANFGTVASFASNAPNGSIASSLANTYIACRDDAYTSASDFKTAVSGVQLCYELAAPITIQLTPNQINSLYGVNNIWADSGDSTVEYRADTKLYIERLTAPDSADMVADANITSGQYFMVGNSLYKATANIANGSAIVVGTNCTRKSLSEALNEINA